jgi:hypothetical protein
MGMAGLELAEAFGKAGEFRFCFVRSPDDTAILEDADDHASRRAPEGLDVIAGLEGSGLAEGFDGLDHGFLIQHPGDIMGHG